MKIKDVVIQMDNLLATEDHWCKRTYAKDHSHRAVRPEDPTAVCWCLMGALCNVRKDTNKLADPMVEFLDEALAKSKLKVGGDYSVTAYKSIPGFNDGCFTTFEDVKAFLKECQELPEAEAELPA